MKTEVKKISALSKVLLVLSGILLAASIFVPMWRIDLDAPQYPEGLRLLIHANKLGGNVDIINGLNHYIGMKTLHSEEFVEFTVLPYILGAYALLCMLVAVSGRRKHLNILFTLLVLFGIVAMVDFWRWEYEYGHDLDPNAAIIVPGMAYQPPLIGFKQLLNFGAYSIPDLGGWMIVGSGVLMLICVIMENNLLKRSGKKSAAAAMALVLILLSSCGGKEPEAIKVNKDACDFCKMTISDIRFASELITSKGRVYKFDDISCMKHYISEQENAREARYFVADFLSPQNFLKAEDAFYVHSESVASPMGGNLAAFSSRQVAESHASELSGTVAGWDSISK